MGQAMHQLTQSPAGTTTDKGICGQEGLWGAARNEAIATEMAAWCLLATPVMEAGELEVRAPALKFRFCQFLAIND